jgi:D-arabinose 1-dehydrogenase-like Zn-dependent alcohol dehydrogenase
MKKSIYPNVLVTVLPLLLYVLFKICRTLFVEAPLTDLSISMKGKTIFITGSSDGIGRLSALHLAKMGADIIFACRNETKTRKVMKEISKGAPNSKVI